MKFEFYIVDVFSAKAFGGNQLAVLPEAEGLSPAAMQDIAREFNFSETTFVSRVPSQIDCFDIRIFTPTSELDFAGHPTIGTACVLAAGGYAKGRQLTLREHIGPISVQVEDRGGVFYATMTLAGKLQRPADGAPSLDGLAAALSLGRQDLRQSFCASLGLPFNFVQLASRDAVDRSRLDRELWKRHLSGAAAPHVFVFSGSFQDGELYARMFAPALGIQEDPATGSACAALVAAFADHMSESDLVLRLRIRQGVALGRPSDIEACAIKSAGRLESVRVGGATAFVASGVLDIPDRH